MESLRAVAIHDYKVHIRQSKWQSSNEMSESAFFSTFFRIRFEAAFSRYLA